MCTACTYTTEDVLNLMNDVDEPMCENSDDDLGIHDSDDETRYITQAQTHKNTCKMAIVYMKLEKNYRCVLMLNIHVTTKIIIVCEGKLRLKSCPSLRTYRRSSTSHLHGIKFSHSIMKCEPYLQ